MVVPYPFIPPTNGGQRVCYNFCHALSKKFYTICVSCDRNNHESRFDVMSILKRSLLKYFDPSSIISLIKVFHRRKINTCVVNHPFFFPAAYIACKVTGRKLITYSHNLEYRRLIGRKRHLRPCLFGLEFLAYRFSDIAFFISRPELSDAVRLFHLDKNRCFFVPHVVHKHPSLLQARNDSNSYFKIIFFGDFSYPPNLDGLKALITNIVPLLADRLNFDYRLIIFGKNIPDSISATFDLEHLPIRFLGFVENPNYHIETADVMINPICAGAGVQTKIIEAISLGTTVLSAQGGSRGVEVSACGEKLITVSDDDWNQYVDKLITINRNDLHLSTTPTTFFDVYSEKNVMNTVTSALETLAG